VGDLTKITTHEVDAVARLPQQHKDRPKLEGLVRLHAARYQKIEDTLFDVLAQRALSEAVGEQLDVIGRVLTQGREGMVDDIYRRALAARLLVLRSRGTIEDVIAICVALLADGVIITRDDVGVRVENYYPAAIVVRLTSPVPNDAALVERLFEYLRISVSAGVRVTLEWNPSGDEDTFTWDSTDPDQVWDAGDWAAGLG
jgi:hypothetical protein